MILWKDIKNRVSKANGMCSDAESLEIGNRAIEVLKNTGFWDPRIGMMDVCCSECEVTLPDDVETPLAVNVGGYPLDFKNKWFEFHLNGPGTECCASCDSWESMGEFPIFRDIGAATTLAALPDQDEGAAVYVRVFGTYNGDPVFTDHGNGYPEEGMLVNVGWGGAYGVQTTQKIDRITHIIKPVTKGFVKIMAYDTENPTGFLIGYLRPADELPRFQRIKISGSGCCCLTDGSIAATSTWVRMRYLRRQYKLVDDNSVIFLHHDSGEAIVSAVMYTKKKDNDLIEEAHKYLQDAKMILKGAERQTSRPGYRIQVEARNMIGGIGNFR